MGDVVALHHDRASTRADGRSTPEGQQAPSWGQLSENHCSAPSSRPTVISAPSSSAESFLVSPNARQDTAESVNPVATPYVRATVKSCVIPFMAPPSVNLPVLSTVILPGATGGETGHLAGMEAEVILRNIQRLLRKQGRTRHAVSIAAGHPDAIRNFARAVARGKGRISVQTLSDLAKELGTTTEDLQRAPVRESAPEAPEDQVLQSLDLMQAQIDLLQRQMKTRKQGRPAQEEPPKRPAKRNR